MASLFFGIPIENPPSKAAGRLRYNENWWVFYENSYLDKNFRNYFTPIVLAAGVALISTLLCIDPTNTKTQPPP